LRSPTLLPPSSFRPMGWAAPQPGVLRQESEGSIQLNDLHELLISMRAQMTSLAAQMTAQGEALRAQGEEFRARFNKIEGQLAGLKETTGKLHNYNQNTNRLDTAGVADQLRAPFGALVGTEVGLEVDSAPQKALRNSAMADDTYSTRFNALEPLYSSCAKEETFAHDLHRLLLVDTGRALLPGDADAIYVQFKDGTFTVCHVEIKRHVNCDYVLKATTQVCAVVDCCPGPAPHALIASHLG